MEAQDIGWLNLLGCYQKVAGTLPPLRPKHRLQMLSFVTLGPALNRMFSLLVTVPFLNSVAAERGSLCFISVASLA